MSAAAGAEGAADARPLATARGQGLAACDCCGLLSRAGQAPALVTRCPRCGCALHARKPRSVQRTVAYLVAAVLLYIPANLLPVMTTVSVFGPYQHTLVGGIGELWTSGSPGLAVIVFIASIAVPLLKIGVLGLLAWTARRRSRWRQQGRARLYRLVESVGHWSMLDVFVVVLLVGMVRFGAFASVQAEAGLLAFGAVVVLTMLASASFDPRLIWPAEDAASIRAGTAPGAGTRR